MIGANEYCAYDLHWNVIAVRSSPKDINYYLECANALGLPVDGLRIMLPKREIEAHLVKEAARG